MPLKVGPTTVPNHLGATQLFLLPGISAKPQPVLIQTNSHALGRSIWWVNNPQCCGPLSANCRFPPHTILARFSVSIQGPLSYDQIWCNLPTRYLSGCPVINLNEWATRVRIHRVYQFPLVKFTPGSFPGNASGPHIFCYPAPDLPEF